MEDRKNIYQSRIKEKEILLNAVTSKCNFVSVLRLIIVLLAIVLGYFLYKYDRYNAMFLEIIISIIIFIIVVRFHSRILDYKKWIEDIIGVNKQALSRSNEEWKTFSDNGKEYLNIEDPFSADLDIFGKNSLFQWINTSTTIFGRERLREILLIKKLPSKEEIYERQNSLKELGLKLDFRQELQVIGKGNSKKEDDIKNFLEWAKGKDNSILKMPIKIISIIIPAITIASILLYFPFKIIENISIPISILIINQFIIKLLIKNREDTIDIMYQLKNSVKCYFSMIEKINNEEFKSNELKSIKNKLLNKNGESVDKALKELSSLENKVADRGNMIYIIINSLFLWDIHLLISLENWRRNYGYKVQNWIDVLADIEALSSLSNLSADKKEWVYPSVSSELILKAKDLGHPFLSDKIRVCNDFEVNKNKSVVLITGSNMSGKSTFLRTIGINMIFTYLGLPVCAKEFSCPILRLYTCMRIGDNLGESISSFYAEILRIKKLIEATERGEEVFFLLDEIFRGTNSVDRHTGAEILINQLCKKTALGFISTHDLELCDMEDKNSKVVNYNFKEYYENNKIKFDYKLRRGQSNTRNAVYLMKMAGIDI